MKRWYLTAAAFTLLIAPAIAQPESHPYWVVEGNIRDKHHALLSFYDGRNELIYRQKLRGGFPDITKQKKVKWLNRKLEDFLWKYSQADRRAGEMAAKVYSRPEPDRLTR